MAKVLEPYKDATTYISSKSYPTTISSLGPLYVTIQEKLTPTNDDSAAIEFRFKRILAVDVGTRYQDPTVSLCLNKAKLFGF